MAMAMATSDASVLAPAVRADDFFSDEPLYEVIDGLEVAKPIMGVFEGSIASILFGELFAYLKQADHGRVVSEVMFRIHPGKRSMRRPDVAFVSFKRWGRDQKLTSENGWEVVPDLAVEVISPTDLAVEVMDKVLEYLSAGVVQVWVVYPNARHILIFDNVRGCLVINSEGVLDGEDLLPGFQLPLAELFRDGVDSKSAPGDQVV